MVIVAEGEFQLSKQKFRSTFLNDQTGQLKIKTQGRPVFSHQTKLEVVKRLKLETPSSYRGSKLHIKIKDYLDGIVKEDQSVEELMFTERGRKQTNHVPFAVIGPGQMHGESDLHRKSIYRLSCLSQRASAFVISKADFLSSVDFDVHTFNKY